MLVLYKYKKRFLQVCCMVSVHFLGLPAYWLVPLYARLIQIDNIIQTNGENVMSSAKYIITLLSLTKCKLGVNWQADLVQRPAISPLRAVSIIMISHPIAVVSAE